MIHDRERQVLLDTIASGVPVYAAAEVAGIKLDALNYLLKTTKKARDESSADFTFMLAYKKAREQGLRVKRKQAEARRADPQDDSEPITNRHNPIHLSLFCEEKKKVILESLHRGGSFSAAAEKAGVLPAILFYWREQGRADLTERNQPDTEFAKFFTDTLMAVGTAKIDAEARVWEDMPINWLLYGPQSRPTESQEGWTKQSALTLKVENHPRIVTFWGGTAGAGTPPSLPEYYPGSTNANGNGHIVEAGIPALIGPEADNDTEVE